MRGPWAGEVGQFQFVPSVYWKYAVDFDGNGRRDLIHKHADALASAANYLDGLGWQPGQPWLEEVRVPAEMDWSQADVTIKKPRSYWAQAGVTIAKRQGAAGRQHAVILGAADGPQRPGLPRLSEFRRLSSMEPVAWSIRLTAGYYATRLAGAPALSRGNGEIETLPLPQAKLLQQILAKRGFDVGKIDGVIGAASRNAIRQMQMKYGLPADGYPTPELLAALQGGR